MENCIKLQVIIQGVGFVLDGHQIQFDAPNYFTDYFLGDWNESPAEERHIELPWRDPELFSIIISYLSGYSVVPLDEIAVPKYLSPARALLNLRADARFYRLGGLVDACNEQLQCMGIEDVPKKRHLVISTTYTLHGYYPDNLAETIFQGTCVWKTYVPEASLTQAPFDTMATLESQKDFEGLRSAGAAEQLMARSLDEYNQHRYRLVGWLVKAKPQSNNMEGLIVCEDWGVD